MKSKLGLVGDNKDDLKLINSLLNWMEKNKADYTNTFCHLMGISSDDIYKNSEFILWMHKWKKRCELNNSNKDRQIKLMRENNPIIIPRNHKVEEALIETENGNLNKFNKLLNILKNPYEIQINNQEYKLPTISKEKYQTFCGT